jgi:hypothetical protein
MLQIQRRTNERIKYDGKDYLAVFQGVFSKHCAADSSHTTVGKPFFLDIRYVLFGKISKF